MKRSVIAGILFFSFLGAHAKPTIVEIAIGGGYTAVLSSSGAAVGYAMPVLVQKIYEKATGKELVISKKTKRIGAAIGGGMGLLISLLTTRGLLGLLAKLKNPKNDEIPLPIDPSLGDDGEPTLDGKVKQKGNDPLTRQQQTNEFTTPPDSASNTDPETTPDQNRANNPESNDGAAQSQQENQLPKNQEQPPKNSGKETEPQAQERREETQQQENEQKTEQERKNKEDEDRKANEEKAQRKQEETEKKQQEEAKNKEDEHRAEEERKKNDEAEQKQKEEERKQQEEADRKAKAEQDRKNKEDEEKRQKEEDNRKKIEEAKQAIEKNSKVPTSGSYRQLQDQLKEIDKSLQELNDLADRDMIKNKERSELEKNLKDAKKEIKQRIAQSNSKAQQEKFLNDLPKMSPQELQKKLTQEFYNPDSDAVAGKTGLGQVARECSEDAEKAKKIQLLLDHGADPNKKVVYGPDKTPAAMVSFQNSLFKDATMKQLLEAGANANATIEYNHHGTIHTRTCLDDAISSGYIPDKKVKLLLDNGADPNLLGNSLTGEYPLHKAVEKAYVEVVKLLLQHGADAKKKIESTYYPGSTGKTALDLAREEHPKYVHANNEVMEERYRKIIQLLEAAEAKNP